MSTGVWIHEVIYLHDKRYNFVQAVIKSWTVKMNDRIFVIITWRSGKEKTMTSGKGRYHGKIEVNLSIEGPFVLILRSKILDSSRR